MEPTVIISTIALLAKEAYNLVQKVEINKSQCARLATRIQSVSTILSRLEKVEDSVEFKTNLEGLHQQVIVAKDLIASFAEKTNWIKKALRVGTDEQQFKLCNDALSDKITDLKLSINVQQLFNREQDKQDLQSDTALLERFHQEVMEGQERIQQLLKDARASQDAQAREMLVRLQSLKQHVQGNSNQTVVSKIFLPTYQSNTQSLASAVVLLSETEIKAVYTQGQQAEKIGNFTEAAKHYEQAANAGYYRAKTNLGTCCLKGQGVTENKPKAYQLFVEAAEAGHTRAMCNLFVMLWEGDGVPENKNEAKKWLKEAIEKGDDWAIKKQVELRLDFAKLTL